MTELNYAVYSMLESVVIALLLSHVTLLFGIQPFHVMYKKYGKVSIGVAGAVFSLLLWFMLFFDLLGIGQTSPLPFNKKLIFLSYFLMALTVTGGIWVLHQTHGKILSLILTVLAMGLSLSFAHYLGLLGLLVERTNTLHFPIYLFAFSIFISILGIGICFKLFFRLKNDQKKQFMHKIAIAIVMAFSIVIMHYIGVLAANFSFQNSHSFQTTIFGHTVIFGIVIVACLVLIAAFFVALLELRLQERNRQLSEMNKELTHLTMHDSLTQLPNRLYLNDYAKEILAEHRLHRQQIGVVYIDLDRFKAINDAFGHHVGDELLVQLANRISEQLTERQKLLRISGDEFLLIAEHASTAQAEQFAQNVLHAIQHGFVIAGRNINITASIGIAMYPDHGETLQELLMHADIAMLASKEQGRNTYSVFSYHIDQYEERHQSKLINDLFKAIEEDQFVLFYQPKFNKYRKICGVEALIRWQHPKLGLLGPNMFIPLAEKTGLITPLGYWVMEQACKQIQLWEQQNKNFYPISINLSAVQVEHKALIQTLQDYLAQYQINTNHLIIEITESTAMHHIDSSIEIFQKIRNLGIKLSIDDFGTGHSSFLYLKDLPVNELKIDRAFIKDLHRGSKDELILASLIQLTRNLGLTVTAEGIETEEQLEILNRLGCQQFQGFLLGKPFPREVLETKFAIYTS